MRTYMDMMSPTTKARALSNIASIPALKADVERYKTENRPLLERTALRLLLMDKGRATTEDMEKTIDFIGWRYMAYRLLRGTW